MHTPGSKFVPPGFHAGGLLYHEMAPLISYLKELNLLEASAYHQNAYFVVGIAFRCPEGILPAPESNHAVKGAIEEAIVVKEKGNVKLFSLSFLNMITLTCKPILIIIVES